MSRHVLVLVVAAVLATALTSCLPVQGPGDEYIPRADRCGNGSVDEGEVCDVNEMGGASCLGLGFGDGPLGCADDCNDYDRTLCVAPASCGDGVRQAPEICDGNDLAGLSCESLGYASGTLSCLGNCGEIELGGCVPVQALDAGSGPVDGAPQDQGQPADAGAQDHATTADGSTTDANTPVDGGPLPDGAASDAGPADAAAAVIKWKYGDRAVGHPAVGADGRIYAIRGLWVTTVESPSNADADEVIALNPNGTLAWSFAETDRRFVGAPAVTADGTVHVVGYPGRLFALNPDGSKRWVFEATRGSGWSVTYGYLSQPAFGPDGSIYLGAPERHSYTGAPPSYFYALDRDGSERWYLELANTSSSPVINAAGAPIAVCSGVIQTSGNIPDALRRLDPASGATSWDLTSFWPVDDPARERHMVGLDLAMAPGGALSMTAYRYPTLEAADGDTVLLRVAQGATAPTWITEALTDDVLTGPVFATDGRGFMPMCTASYAADEVRVVSSTGQISTHATLDGSEHAVGQPALAADGSLYVVMNNNPSDSYPTYALYAVTPAGQIRWTLDVDYPTGGVTIGNDGTVYVPTSSGLLAIQGSSPLAASGWADQHGGLANLRSAAPPPASYPDAGVDAGTDAGVDAGTDAGFDAGTDAGATVDSGTSICSPACTGDETCQAGVCRDPAGCPSHSHLVDTFCECDEGYVVNTAGTACELDSAPGNSCQGHCGGPSADGTCYCTSDCATYNDCCADYQATCG